MTLKENCEEKTAAVVEEELLEAKNGDSSLISEAMAQEEEQLLKIREDEEKAKCAGSGEAPDLNDIQFNKLDELLTQTQLYSEFLLEKMEDITKVIFILTFLFFLNESHCFLIEDLCFARMGLKVRTKRPSPRRVVVDAKERLHPSATQSVPSINSIYQ